LRIRYKHHVGSKSVATAGVPAIAEGHSVLAEV